MENEEQNVKKQNNKIKWIPTVVLFLFVTIGLGAGLWFMARDHREPKEVLVMTVAEQKVYLDEVNLYCLENAAALGLTKKSLDTTTAEDGTSAEDYYKQEILQLIVNNKVAYKKAVSEGEALTEEEQKSVNAAVDDYIGSQSADLLKQFGISKDVITQSYEERYLVNKYIKKISDDVEFEDFKFCTIYLMLFPKVKMNKDGSYVTDTDGETPILLDEDEIKKVKKDADAAYKKLKAGEKEADVAKEYGVELISGEESDLVGNFGEPFDEYADTLKKDEISPVLDTLSCYAIVKMIKENDEAFTEQITRQYRKEELKSALDEKVLEWNDEYNIHIEDYSESRVWIKLSLYDFVQ